MRYGLALFLMLVGPSALAQQCIEAQWRQVGCPQMVYRSTPQEPVQKMVCVCKSDFIYLQNYASVDSFAEQNLLTKELERLAAIYQLEQNTLRQLFDLPIRH